jgi:hypothetical protein
MKTLLHYFLVLFCTLVCSVTGYSQINYSQNFNVNAGGWNEDYFWYSTTQSCGGMSLLGEFYYVDFGDGDIITDFAETVSPSLGTSNGLPMTINFNYKLYDYWNGIPVDNTSNWGSVVISYSTAPSGPWTTLHTITQANHVPSSSCVIKTATITPTVGAQIYLRVVGTPTETDGTDILFVMDDVTAVQQLPACTGAPAASAAVVLNGPVCAQQNASLALTPAYGASGITYQWQGSPNGTTYTNIAGATSATFSGSQAQGPWYRAVVTCTGSGTSTTSTGVQASFSTSNCPPCPVEFVNDVEPITQVTFSTLTNTSSNVVNGSPDVEDFTALPAPSVNTGQAYTFSAQGHTGGNFTTWIKVYIDFNKNGNLNDPGESFEIGSVANSVGTDGVTASAPIFIPTNASPGITTMRVFKLYNVYSADPCGTGYGYGQVEQYLVNIVPCTTVAPTATAAQTFCANATVANLAATGTAVKWYNVASGGTPLPTTQALVAGTYYASQTNVCEGSARAAVAVTITVVPADDPADVTNCGPYVLPALTNGVYRTAIGGGGTVVAAGTSISATTTLYIRNSVGPCSIDNSMLITINNPVADDPADVAACGSYTLPALTNGAYRTATAGGGTVVTAGTAITTTTTLYVYSAVGTCTAEHSFTITVNNTEADNPADVNACGIYELPGLSNGNYFTQSGGLGTAMQPGDEITETTTLYVYNSENDCAAENSFTVTIDNFEVDNPADVAACNSYILPELTSGSYFTGGSGLGTPLEAGDAVTETMTIHVYGASTVNPACTADNAFTITIITVEADEMDDVATCSTYTLPALSPGNNYYTGTGGTGTALSPGDVVSSSQTIYIYKVAISTLTCTAETSFDVAIVPLETPGDIIVTVESATPPMIYDVDLEVEYEGTITYYTTEEDAMNEDNPVSETQTAPQGATTYYAVLSDGNCTSEPFAVVFEVILGTDKFDMVAFSYYPNPVTDVLNLSYSENITGVEVINLLGQKVLSGSYNQNEVQVNLSQLASGTYLVKVTTENASKTIKVLRSK